MIDFSIQDLINKSVNSEREKYIKKSWWAGDLGKCLSGVYYERLGVEPDTKFDDRTLRVFKAGNLFENFVIEQLKKLDTAFETQVRVEMPEYDLTGYADLVINDLVYEIKSKHSRAFWYMQKDGKPDEHYLMQLYCYMMALKKEEGRLIFISKDDLTIAEYPIFLSDGKLKTKVLSELEILNASWKKQTPPDPAPAIVEGKINWKASFCRYHSHCTNNPNWLKEAQKQLKVGNKK